MKKMVYEVLGVSPERVDELCEHFITESGGMSDEVMNRLKLADIPSEEKMVVAFAIGFMSAVDFLEQPHTILKSNDMVH